MGVIPNKSVDKSLSITLVDRNVPTYEFKGEWSGRDIMVVGRTIARAYRKEQLAKRRTFQNLVVSDQIEAPIGEIK